MSQADVSYCCGSCRYPLNLKSTNCVTSSNDSKYRRSISKGYISFRSIDPSRFTQVDKVQCWPMSWAGYVPRSKLLCRRCGVLIGYGYGFQGTAMSSTSFKKIMVKIRALQPSESSTG